MRGNNTHRSILFVLLAAAGLVPAAAGQVTKVGSTLRITTGAADDDFKVISGPVPGYTEVHNVAGVPSGITFMGISRIEINTNGGLDKVQIESYSASPPALFINTGTGESLVNIDMLVPPTAAPVTSTIRVTGGSQIDVVNFNVESFADSITMVWDVLAGGGFNETKAVFLSDIPSSFTALDMGISGGAGNDTASIEVNSRADVTALNLDGNLGAGFNEYKAMGKGSGASETNLSTALVTGNGIDKVLLEFTESALTTWQGTIDTFGGADEVVALFPSALTGYWKVATGEGNDKGYVLVNGPISGTARYFLEGGNDFLEFLADNVLPGSSIVSDGGPGIDEFKGVGTALNFEKLN